MWLRWSYPPINSGLSFKLFFLPTYFSFFFSGLLSPLYFFPPSLSSPLLKLLYSTLPHTFSLSLLPFCSFLPLHSSLATYLRLLPFYLLSSFCFALSTCHLTVPSSSLVLSSLHGHDMITHLLANMVGTGSWLTGLPIWEFPGQPYIQVLQQAGSQGRTQNVGRRLSPGLSNNLMPQFWQILDRQRYKLHNHNFSHFQQQALNRLHNAIVWLKNNRTAINKSTVFSWKTGW